MFSNEQKRKCFYKNFKIYIKLKKKQNKNQKRQQFRLYSLTLNEYFEFVTQLNLPHT